MTKRYKMLRKKVQELESDLTDILSHSSECELKERIVSVCQNFNFVKSLLSAEISSNPSRPRHLSHIFNRLAKLEAVFEGLYSGSDRVDPVESGSRCSCTESCLNDDGDSEWGQAFYDIDDRTGTSNPNNEGEEEKEELFFEAETNNEKENCDWGNYGTLLAFGVVIGAVLMGFLSEYNGCSSSYVSYPGSLVPT